MKQRRFPYFWFCSPPGPAFLAIVSKGSNYSPPTHALIDTGADQTYIPAKIARDLRLIPKRIDVDVYGAGGSGGKGSLYVADIALMHNGATVFKFSNLLVVSDSSLDEILIGRDVINDYILTLDGPARRFSMKASK